MFAVEPLFIIQEAELWALSDRLKLYPYFELIKKELDSSCLGGNLIIKEQHNLPLTHHDFFVLVKSKEPFEKVKSLLNTLNKLEGRVYMRIIDDEYHIHVGKYYILKWSFGPMSLHYQLSQLYLIMLDGFTDDVKREAEQLTHVLLKGKTFNKPYLSKELRQFVNHRDCAWIEGTNSIITRNDQTINDLVTLTNGILKEYNTKSVIKYDTNKYINIFKTAHKRTFPVTKTDKYIIASPLTSLYHLSLDGDNPRAFDMLKHYQEVQVEGPFYQWGNTEYIQATKYYFPKGEKNR